MTLEYLEITQQDLQREFHLALSRPRQLAPSPTISSGSSTRADSSNLLDLLTVAQHVPEMYRRSLADNYARRLLDRVANRLTKFLAEIRKLNTPQKWAEIGRLSPVGGSIAADFPKPRAFPN